MAKDLHQSWTVQVSLSVCLFYVNKLPSCVFIWRLSSMKCVLWQFFIIYLSISACRLSGMKCVLWLFVFIFSESNRKMNSILKMGSQIRQIKWSQLEEAVLELVVPDARTVLIISMLFKCLVSWTASMWLVKFHSRWLTFIVPAPSSAW